MLRKRVKEFLIEYLGAHPCVDCGEHDIVVLEFDHVSNKSSDIASMLKNRNSIKIVESEIKKCEVRCANCHRRKTARYGNWYRVVEGNIARSNAGQ
jgi:hypothetical protein